MMPHPTVILIDDEWGREDDPMIRENYGRLPVNWVRETAGTPGHHHPAPALELIKRVAPQMVFLDIDFGPSQERLGLDILKAIRDNHPTLPVVIFTTLHSSQNRELVVQCLEFGANEYIEKAPSPDRMLEVISLYSRPDSDYALYGNSEPIRRVRAEIARIAFGGEASVLIVGESGTGKELVARALHRQGPHRQGPFIAKNCAHADGQLLDSEMFGHEKGSFTGATERRKGLLEEADGGILFLDEVADMSSELQAKLLRTLETRTLRRLGGTKDVDCRFMLVCAVNRNPDDLLVLGRLREDFYYRVGTIQLRVPPLREHTEDIPILASRFLSSFKARGGQSYPGERFSKDFSATLLRHKWPGNVRELRNVVERAIILSKTPTLDAGTLPDPLLRKLDTRSTITETPSRAMSRALPPDQEEWPIERLCAELRMAVEAKATIQKYKGRQWKAEFMRLLYPECKAASAKGFEDLIKRLTSGPWGLPNWKESQAIQVLLDELRS